MTAHPSLQVPKNIEELQENLDLTEDLMQKLQPIIEARKKQREVTEQINGQLATFTAELSRISGLMADLTEKLAELEQAKSENLKLEKEALNLLIKELST